MNRPKLSAALFVLLTPTTLTFAQDVPAASGGAPSARNGSDSQPKTIDGQLVYKVGGDIKPPKGVDMPPPTYSKQARKAKYQGICVLWLVVGTDGQTHNIRVARTLGMGLDEEAIEAVKHWKFEPATKDGQPVAVQVNVEVTFHLR